MMSVFHLERLAHPRPPDNDHWNRDELTVCHKTS